MLFNHSGTFRASHFLCAIHQEFLHFIEEWRHFLLHPAAVPLVPNSPNIYQIWKETPEAANPLHEAAL